MGSLFDFFLGESRRHINDEQLLSLMDGELSMAQSRRVQKHLERCWNCRTRHERLQGVIHGFVDYSNEVVAPYVPPPPHGRDRFLRALDAELSPKSRMSRVLPLKTLRAFSENVMNPVVLTVIVVLVASTVLALVWSRAVKHGPTTEQLLTQAIRSEQAVQQHDGVAYQKVEIRTPHRIFERSIYRDLAGKKVPVQPKLTDAERSLKSRLESAGVDWQNPLSPSDFKTWHSRVHVVSDQVRQTGEKEWTLTAETDDSTVREASLTIRDEDFYPVRRRVVFRDAEALTVTELNHDVLPWSAVNMALFEPVPGSHIGGRSEGDTTSLYREIPSPAQLTRAELEAQLALVQIHATDGEDVHVERGEAAIFVRGVVATDDRKREIAQELSRFTLVKPEVLSLEQIERQRLASSSNGPVQVRTSELQPSPLETLLSEKAVSAEQIIALSRQLVQSSITIAREARALSNLDQQYRGASGATLDEESGRLLRTLVQRHVDTLIQALTSEDSALASYASDTDFRDTETARPLSEMADNNQSLCEELVGGSGVNVRPGAEILHDLIRVTAQIRRTANAIQSPQAR